ncbi:MAG: TolC family protein, partial [Candidatus Zixiibacteriota bacterium]
MGLKYFRLCTALILIASGSGIASAEVLTLDDCISLALRNHESVVDAVGQVKVYNGNLWLEAGNSFLPGITASAYVREIHATGPEVINGIQTGQMISGVSKFYGIGIGAGMTLFNGGRNVHNYLRAKADKKRSEYLLESTRQDIIFLVKQKYFDYLRALDKKKISEEAVKRGEEQYKLASSKYEVGSASKSDVLKAKVQFGTDQLGLLSADNRVRTAHAELSYIIGIDVNSDAEFSGAYQQKEYNDTEQAALKFGLANHPGLQASAKYVTASKYDVRSAWGRFLPSVTLNVSRDWSNSRWSEVKKFNEVDGQWTITTSVNLPIFEQFWKKRELARTKATLNSARASYYYTRNNVAYGIKTAYLEITRT